MRLLSCRHGIILVLLCYFTVRLWYLFKTHAAATAKHKTVENLENTRWPNTLSRKHSLITIFISQCQGFNARHHAPRQALRQMCVYVYIVVLLVSKLNCCFLICCLAYFGYIYTQMCIFINFLYLWYFLFFFLYIFFLFDVHVIAF